MIAVVAIAKGNGRKDSRLLIVVWTNSTGRNGEYWLSGSTPASMEESMHLSNNSLEGVEGGNGFFNVVYLLKFLVETLVNI